MPMVLQSFTRKVKLVHLKRVVHEEKKGSKSVKLNAEIVRIIHNLETLLERYNAK